MENIGFNIIPKAKKKSEALKLYKINNPDGSVRWLWSAGNRRPDFLKFYSATSIQSKLFVLAIRFLFLLRLQHLLFNRKALWAKVVLGHKLEGILNDHFAVFTGTPGPNRKMVLYTSKEGSKPQFVKISFSTNSESLLAQEFKNTYFIRNLNLNKLEVPNMTMLSKGILATSDISTGAIRSNSFGHVHANALAELLSKTIWYATPQSLDCIKVAQSNLDALLNNTDKRIPTLMLQKLLKLGSLVGDQNIFTAFAHGDFTPWNTYTKESKLGVYDWELAKHGMPAAFDLFHFVIQKGILTERKSWQAIRAEAAAAFDLLANKTKLLRSSDFDRYLAIYLYINTSYYLDVYSRQTLWHQQITWLLSTWDEAISFLLNDKKNTRTLFIDSLFSHLHNWKYAAIKFPESHPGLLSEYADIDLTMSQKDTKTLIKYLKKHSFVKSIVVRRKTNMVQLMLVLINDSILALDLIFGFKQRHMHFMELKPVLSNANYNRFGVKVMSSDDTAHYLKHFYGLNESKVPEKYHRYFHKGKADNESKTDLIRSISNLPANKGLNGIKSRLAYFFDSFRSVFFNRGLIVTFSGVDGAGKTTVIELTKKEIEKKLRKPVVVIRHRPSLLPILSAVKHGKEKASQIAAQSLPRQGTNKNILGSLLRFAYYYSDYFFGQFYIYVKYIMRGKVVLYDRYYFDFINDSRRSNIQLPKWLLKSGYFFLLKPRFNFFLYADAKTILSRKKELDAQTIEQLTQEYLDLFESLNRKGKNRYFPIENIVLDDTMAFITDNVSPQLTY